jgi:tRNA nucleotidyltransferase/poly(A) polymerase
LSDRHDAQIALMKFLSAVARHTGASEHVYIVGGAVRDFVMGRPIKDVDVVVDAVSLGRDRDSAWFAEQVVRHIPVEASYVTNQYGVAIITVKDSWILDGHDLKGEVIEIANARKESYGAGDDMGKGYKPTEVQPATIHEDVERREFTFNCMAGDTLIPTEQGILRIDQIASREGGDHQDINLTVAGQAGPSTAVGWQYSGYAPTLRVTTEWGHSFACTHHHPVLVLRGHDHEWVQADQLEEGDLLCVPPKQVTRQKPLVLALPDPMQPNRGRLKDVIKPERMTPELAFLIGCVVAEGSNTHKRVSFSNSDPNLISRYVECFHATFGFQPSRNKVVEKGSTRILGGVAFFANNDGYDIYADSRAVVGWLEDLGLYCGGSKDGKSASHHKVVPWSILQADERSQWAFLAAYLECDGSIRPDTGRITYCSASPHVRQQLQVLLGAHGILSKVEDRFVYINAVDSALLWEKIQPWMVTKEFDYTHRNNKSRNRYGIPKEYLQGVLLGRRIRVGNNQGPSIYRTDDGGETSQGGVLETLRLSKRILHDAYARGDFDGFMVSLKVISPNEHAKLKRLFDLGYQYVEVTSVEDAGEQDVFDISMGEGVEPAFVANGVVVHNTLLWRLRDLTHGPDRAEVIDLTGCGRRDLEQGLVRCPRDPNIVFSDDPTRLIRLIKFVGRYGFKVPPDVAAAVRRNAPKLANAPWEAIATILVRDVLDKPYARRVLPMMRDLGLLNVIAGMVARTPPFKTYLERELRTKPAHLIAELLEHGLTEPTPVKALSSEQRARFVEVVRGLDPVEAALLSNALQRPPIDNNALIAEFALPFDQRGRLAPAAREALLANPFLASNPLALTDAVRGLLRLGRTAGELIPGGRARNLSPSLFDPEEIARGVRIEREHTPDSDIAQEIAMDHLTEFPDYYTRLERMESEARTAAAIPKKYEHIDFKPPQGVADAAAKGLELRRKASPSNRGGFTPAQAAEEGIGSGVQRAVNLKNRDTVSPKVIKQMVAFFARHEKNKDVPADKKGEPWNAKGHVAWLLWGGDPGRTWAEKVRDQMEAADEKEKASKKAARTMQARTYNRLVMYDFDGTLFRSWEKTPDWWENPTPYSFFDQPASLDEPCVPGHPGNQYWINKTVQAAQGDTRDRSTYSVLITGRMRVHTERISALLEQKGIRFNKMLFNPGMAAAKFKSLALGHLLASYNTINEVVIWENENQSHYAQYLATAATALGRDIKVIVHNIHEAAVPLACGPQDFGIEPPTASMRRDNAPGMLGETAEQAARNLIAAWGVGPRNHR